MVYITHKTPTPRSWDTPLGKVMGYMAEYLYWIQQEANCIQVDAIVPEWWPIGVIDDIFINIFRNAYNASYQKVYNEGARRGNKLENQVLGWIEDTKRKIETDFNALLSDAKTKLQSQIDELNRLANRFSSQIAELESAKNKLLSDFENLDQRLRQLADRATRDIKALEEAKDRLFREIESLDERVRKLEAQKLPFIEVPRIRV